MRELEPNLARLIRAAELPDPDEGLDVACADFLSRLRKPPARERRLLPVAAAVAFAAVVGAIVARPPEAPPRPAAVPQAEPVDPVIRALGWLAARQNPDGSWGAGRTTLDGVGLDKPGLTGLAMLALLGAGYSHLSKDLLGDRKAGDVMTSGMRWLTDGLQEDGRFRSSAGTLDQAVAAEALCEAYGLTGSPPFKEPAQRAIRALEAMQANDGSWGDAMTTRWAVGASVAAEISGLRFSEESRARLLAFFDRRKAPDPDELHVRIRFEHRKDHPAVQAVAAQLRNALPTPDEPIDRLYARTTAAYMYDGASGELWKAWRKPFRASVLSRLDAEGAWIGAVGGERLVRTMVATLCLEIFYRYAAASEDK